MTMRKCEQKKTACRGCQGSEPRPDYSHVAGAKLPPGRPAGAGEAGFWIHPSFISGAARGLLKEFEAGNELAFQLAGLPLLELCRLVHAGKEFELRIRELETRIKALEKKAAQK